MHKQITDAQFFMLPRTVQRVTQLGRADDQRVAVIYPAGSVVYRQCAETIHEALYARCGVGPELCADQDVITMRSDRLPDTYRSRPLILLGNLNNNRAILPLYANYYCTTDAAYPGGDGYDLRTIVNPYGTGSNVILAGGSSAAGVQRAVGRLCDHIRTADGRIEVPFLHEVLLEPALAAALAAWTHTPLNDTGLKESRARGFQFYTDLIRTLGAYTIMWWWTADERYALVARDSLRALNSQVEGSYGDWHYLAERVLRALPLLTAGGFLSDADIARTDELLLSTALGTQNDWWRMRHDKPPFGHRHHGKGTYEFLLLARYLRDYATPNPAVRALCDTWIDECYTYLDALGRARIDDQDDESTLNNLATLFWYALGEERYDFFESGNARLVTERVLALHDNSGTGAGQGGYGEGLAGAMYFQQEATVQVASSAFYYQDSELKWILEYLPNLSIPQRYGFLHYAPVFVHKFDTGSELPAVEPETLSGIQVLPVTGHQYTINVDPPENIEYAGHMANALETWQRAEGIDFNQLPQVRGFDKLVFRGGFRRHDPYLILQGYQGGYRWQGHMQAANCIVRFAQAGHIFLIQNTSRHSHYDKNGLFISDGYNDTLLPPIAEWLAVDDFVHVGLSATRLSNYHHADWTRHVFWSKAGDGFFVVLDSVTFKADAPYSLTCTWRTLAYAELDDRRWHSDQGEHRFTLVAGAELSATSEEEADQGAAVPYVLRQRQAGTYQTGQRIAFHNMFYVRPLDAPEALDLCQIDHNQATVTRAGEVVAWCGISVDTQAAPDGLWVNALSAWAEHGHVALAGALLLAFTSTDWRVESDRPIGIALDITTRTLTLRPDGPAAETAHVRLIAADYEQVLTLEDVLTLPLVETDCTRIADALAHWLAALNPATRPVAKADILASDSGWHSAWAFDTGTRLPVCVRDVRIKSTPLPVDGHPLQLIDGVLPELREIWRQWPEADHYDIALRFPRPRRVEQLSIIGDSAGDPTLRTFNPLPQGIAVHATGADGERRACAVEHAPPRQMKRYRDMEDSLEARAASIGQLTQRIDIRIPAPPNGQPLVLHEIEIYGDERCAPPIKYLIAADTNGDGQQETVLANAANELILLSANGREVWRRQMDAPVTHLSCQQLTADATLSICVGVLGGDLHIFTGAGALHSVYRIAEAFRQRKDSFLGWFNTIHSLAVWQRDADGRAALVAGGYAILVFLNPEGEVVGHSWGDGSWLTDIAVVPQAMSGAGDLYVRCGWNHGVFYYEGRDGMAPSGEAVVFGGVPQPMFRMMRRVIPFVNGRTLSYEWLASEVCPQGAILAATELGVGLLTVCKRDWHWKLEGGTALRACISGQINGRAAALTGGADGFIAAFDLYDGQPLKRTFVGAPVVGLARAADGGLLVGTRTGILALDTAWKPIARHALPIQRMLALDHQRVVLVRDDHILEMLSLAGADHS